MPFSFFFKLIKWVFIILIPIAFLLAWLPLGLFENNDSLLALATQARTPSIMRFISTLFFAVILVVMFLRKLWFYRCKNCGKLWGLKKKNSFISRTEDISVMMTVKRRNSMGNVIGEKEQYVPGKRRHYVTPYVCKYCGNVKEIIKIRDEASV